MGMFFSVIWYAYGSIILVQGTCTTPNYLSNGTRMGRHIISRKKTRVLLRILKIFEHISMDNDDPTQWIIRLSRTSSRFGSVARGNRTSRSHNKVIVWSTTLSISLDGDQSKQEDSVKRRVTAIRFDTSFVLTRGGGGAYFYELLMELYFS